MRLRAFLGSVVIFATFISFFVAGCGQHENPWPNKPGPKVLTSFVPVDCFVLNVVGDDGTVKPIQTSQSPHEHFDASAAQLKMAGAADVLFILGLTLDDPLADSLKSAGNRKLKVVKLGDSIDPKLLFEGEGDEKGKPDAHVWMNPKMAATMVGTIRDKMKEFDPAHAAGYDSRAAAYIAKMEQLEKDGLAMLKDKKERKIISFHDSLRYFAQCFGIEIAESIQIEPGVEPSGDHLKSLIDLCNKEKIRIIVVEPQFPTNTSAATILNALKKEGIDAEFVVVDPLETADEKELTPDLYERTMRENLDRLAKALK